MNHVEYTYIIIVIDISALFGPRKLKYIQVTSSTRLESLFDVQWMEFIYRVLCGKIKVQLITLTIASKHSNYLMPHACFNMWIWYLELGLSTLFNILRSLCTIYDAGCVQILEYREEVRVARSNMWYQIQRINSRARLSYLFEYLPMDFFCYFLYNLTTYQMPTRERTTVSQCNLQLSKSIRNIRSEWWSFNLKIFFSIIDFRLMS